MNDPLALPPGFHFEPYLGGPALYLDDTQVASACPARDEAGASWRLCLCPRRPPRYEFLADEQACLRYMAAWARRWEAEIRARYPVPVDPPATVPHEKSSPNRRPQDLAASGDWRLGRKAVAGTLHGQAHMRDSRERLRFRAAVRDNRAVAISDSTGRHVSGGRPMAGTEGQDDVELDVWDPELRLDRGKRMTGRSTGICTCRLSYGIPPSRISGGASLNPGGIIWLGCIQKVVTYPVFSNPYAQRYLSCRHGRFKTIAYELDVEHPLPGNVDEAKSHIETVSAFDLFNPCAFGLGLIKDLDEVWRGLAGFANLNAIVLTQSGGLQIDGDTVRIPVVHIESMRRAFNRTNRKVREVVRLGKRTHVRNVLLSRLDPERYPRVMQVNQEGQLIEVRLDHSRTSKNAARSQRRATVDAVRTNVDTLAAEAPQELIRLHAEIERATLAQMIEKYEEMLKKKLPEAEWQNFLSGTSSS